MPLPAGRLQGLLPVGLQGVCPTHTGCSMFGTVPLVWMNGAMVEMCGAMCVELLREPKKGVKKSSVEIGG